ncbi:hypothetical protein CO054_00825, partial [Candidatus Shapirobacteria bacterium CG_4_9_14_0_2_um_filter_39_11]
MNKTAIAIDIPKVNVKSLTFLGKANIGEIAPAENQATAILPAISEARSSWPTENFFIKNNYSIINNHYVKWVKTKKSAEADLVNLTDSLLFSQKNN